MAYEKRQYTEAGIDITKSLWLKQMWASRMNTQLSGSSYGETH